MQLFCVVYILVGRTLGIPTRSVTNFESAHDNDNSLTIDTHFDASFKNIKELDDSIWYGGLRIRKSLHKKLCFYLVLLVMPQCPYSGLHLDLGSTKFWILNS